MLAGHKTFKSALLEFYQAQGIRSREFVFEVDRTAGHQPGVRAFECKLSMPAVFDVPAQVQTVLSNYLC